MGWDGMGWGAEYIGAHKQGRTTSVCIAAASICGFVVLGFRYEDSWGRIVTLPVYAFMLLLLFGSKIYKSLIR